MGTVRLASTHSKTGVTDLDFLLSLFERISQPPTQRARFRALIVKCGVYAHGTDTTTGG
jgi:hypothetical protein